MKHAYWRRIVRRFAIDEEWNYPGNIHVLATRTSLEVHPWRFGVLPSNAENREVRAFELLANDLKPPSAGVDLIREDRDRVLDYVR